MIEIKTKKSYDLIFHLAMLWILLILNKIKNSTTIRKKINKKITRAQ